MRERTQSVVTIHDESGVHDGPAKPGLPEEGIGVLRMANETEMSQATVQEMSGGQPADLVVVHAHSRD
jgi:hypothetical protein